MEFVAVEGERLRDAESCAQVIDEFERAASIVAVHPLAALVTLLRLYRERSDRASFEPFERDRLADLLAVAVGAVIKPLQRSVDLGDQLTLAVARAQLNARSVSEDARSAKSAWFWFSSWRCCSVSLATLRISPLQASSLSRK